MILMFCLFAGLGKQSGCYWFLSQWHLCRWLNFRPLPVMSFPNWVVVHLVDHNSDGDVIKGTGLEVALNLARLQLCGSLHRCLGGRALLRRQWRRHRPIRGCQWEVQVRNFLDHPVWLVNAGSFVRAEFRMMGNLLNAPVLCRSYKWTRFSSI